MAEPEKQRPIVIDPRAWTGDLEADTRIDAEAQKARTRWLEAHPVLFGLAIFSFGAIGTWAYAQAPDAEFGPWWFGWIARRLMILVTAVWCIAGLFLMWRPAIQLKPISHKEGWRAIEKAYAPPQSASNRTAPSPTGDPRSDGGNRN